MGAVSILWFIFLRSFSKNVLDDSIEALGLCIAFYYALTGFACVIVYRRQLLRSVRNFVLMGVMPALGGATMVFLLVESCLSLARKAPSRPLGSGCRSGSLQQASSSASSLCLPRGGLRPASSGAGLATV